MRLAKFLRNQLPLSQRMQLVNNAVQAVGAAQAGLHLIGYQGRLPDHPPHFVWIEWGQPLSFHTPGMSNGEKLSHHHLTPEQMTYCLQHLEELEEWAREMKELEAGENALQEERARERRVREARQAASHQARYEADVRRQLQESTGGLKG